ncbi:uncharacterized protein LOC120083056 isoform X2 [Benincasa hispida]|uniref:uncharacterized protein LOC120083056 isoform X2 n=1 Tax=Benincasa hispida TaxID=102211 RepID=UPI0018FF21F1|nr:uncharacterized protein LOC120083056 isoform X2 [Benincasa hispida]
MARWDEIFSLPVQNPPTLEFSSADLVWSKVEGWRDNMDRVAVIPFARVDDFVRGESSNKECPTRFHVEARRRRALKAPFKAKVDGVLEYILYWCSFGPDDHRKGGVIRPSRSTYVPKKKNAGRPNTKRGCTCHFIVKRLIAEPSIALIIYNEDKHVDKKGLPCHGPRDKEAEGTRAMFAPYISEDLRLRVLSLLYVGVSVETIMQRHNESVEKQGGPCNRDDLLTHRYVRRQERSIRRSTHELDEDDAVSLSMWVEGHRSNVFFYEDFTDTDTFTLGIQTEWQLQQMIRFGNRGLLASDSRFGTNKLKYPVHSLVVFNLDYNAIPVAWIISPRFASGDAHRWMRALHSRVQTKDPSWKLAGFVVDDPLVDAQTIREIFQCSILLSFWRVRHAWHKNIQKKCAENDKRAEILRQLGKAVDGVCRGMWTTALKNLPLTSLETCAAMEFYHSQLKLRLLNEKDSAVYQRTDWLVDKLGTKVHSYFWLDEYSEKNNFSRYWKDEWMSGLTYWRRALRIPDSDVIIEDGIAKVTDQITRDRKFVVWNPGSQFGICDCQWAEMGNLCDHMCKVINVCRKKGTTRPSVSLLQYQQVLTNMLRCPPHDSLIRDHAVSFAMSVQKQLNALISMGSDLESRSPCRDHMIKTLEHQTDREVTGDTEFLRDNVLRNKSELNQHENDCASGQEASNNITDNSSSELVDLTVTGNRVDGETAGRECPCTEMDIDTTSICISPHRLNTVEEVVGGNSFRQSKNRVQIDMEFDSLPYGFNTVCNLNKFVDNQRQQEKIEVDPSPINDPLTAADFANQCMMNSQNGILRDGPETTIAS